MHVLRYGLSDRVFLTLFQPFLSSCELSTHDEVSRVVFASNCNESTPQTVLSSWARSKIFTQPSQRLHNLPLERVTFFPVTLQTPQGTQYLPQSIADADTQTAAGALTGATLTMARACALARSSGFRC